MLTFWNLSHSLKLQRFVQYLRIPKRGSFAAGGFCVSDTDLMFSSRGELSGWCGLRTMMKTALRLFLWNTSLHQNFCSRGNSPMNISNVKSACEGMKLCYIVNIVFMRRIWWIFSSLTRIATYLIRALMKSHNALTSCGIPNTLE